MEGGPVGTSTSREKSHTLGPSPGGWELDKAWHCHCCGKLNNAPCPPQDQNAMEPPRCCICARPATYTVSEFRLFHGHKMDALHGYHVSQAIGEEDREARDEALFRPLHLAAAANNMAVVRALLQGGAYAHVKTTFGWTALHMACERGHVESAALLLEAGADIEALTEELFQSRKQKKKGNSPNIRAIERGVHYYGVGSDESCFLLVGFVQKEELTPLMLAAKKSRTGVVSLLLDRGAEWRVKDVAGRTALHYAAMTGNLEVGNALLQKGIDVDIQDQDGWTARQYADLNGHKNFVKLLILNEGMVSEVYTHPKEKWHSNLWGHSCGHLATSKQDRREHQEALEKLKQQIRALKSRFRVVEADSMV